ncbi:MAG TPA: CHRD domain-containing protein [Gammaproteobacteria bacterium]|nr:CHRD domain-containing protein [Gammaproteobacteria bacterium]
MKNTKPVVVSSLLGLVASLYGGQAQAAGEVKARLDGYQEVSALSTTGSGTFAARTGGGAIAYTLSYQDLEGNVLQAHVHFGQRGVNGGVSAFLCSNLGNGPAGTPLCPPAPGAVSGTVTSAEVIGPGGQGIGAGEIEELLDAIDAGVTYANVHTDLYPGGEIRGQIRRGIGAD